MPIVSMEMDISKMKKALQDAKAAIIDMSNSLDDAQENLAKTENTTKDWNKETEKAIRNQRNLSDELKRATGIVAGLASAYLSLSKLMSFTKEGFAYNEELETSKLGIASVVAATLELQDAQGKVLEGQEKFNAAQAISVDMAKALDIASMQSPASYIDLLSTYQRLLAPATNLGLQWQDTLDLTIKMSNVVKSLGLDMQRLGAETEAIMMGKNLSHSAVAQRLKITKEEIQQWGKGEQLVANLNKRLEQFKYAGVSVENTMSAVREYYDDVMKNISGDMNKNLWQKMKEAMLTVADEIYEQIEVNGRKQFQITESIQPIVDLWNLVGDIIGDKVVGSVETLMDSIKQFGDYLNDKGVENFFDDITRGAKIAGAAIVALTVTKRAMNATFTMGVGKNATEIVGLRSYIAALQERVQKEGILNVVRTQGIAVENAETSATVNNTSATKQNSAAKTEATTASRAHTTAMTQETAAANGLAVSQGKAAASTAILNKASAVGAAALLGLKNVATGLLSIFGGPLGLAMTAAGAGMAYLVTSESDAEKATRLHTQAQQTYIDVIEKATDETGKLKKEVSGLTLEELKRAKTNLERSFDLSLSDAKQKINAIIEMLDPNRNGINASWGFEVDTGKLGEFANELDEIFNKFEQTRDVEAFRNELTSLLNKMDEAKLGTNDARNALNDFLDTSKNTDSIFAIGKSLSNLKGIFDQLTGSINAAITAKQNFDDLKNLEHGIEGLKMSAYISGIKNPRERQIAQTLRSTFGSDIKNSEQLKGYLNILNNKGGFVNLSEDQITKLKEAGFLAGKIYDNNQANKSKGGGGSGNTKSIDSANKSIERLRFEIAQLSGEMTKSSADFEKKMQEIADLGKNANLSADQISLLQSQYREAFKINTLREFNKEVLNLEGNVSAIRQIELEDKIKNWEDRLRAAGIEGQEFDDCMRRMKEGLERDVQIKDTQTAIEFLRQMNEFGQEYGLTVEYQNKLLDAQALMYQQKLPASLQPLIEKWKELQKLQNARDPWSGVKRGTLKFVDEQTNYAKQIETVWTNALDAASDRFADMCIKGESSFEDLALSIIEDLERIMIKALEAQAIGGIMNLIGSAFSGFFSAGSVSSSVGAVSNAVSSVNTGTTSSLLSSAKTGVANVKLANGGVFAGGNLHNFSNSIVTSPTTFSYGVHAFANGAGLMGEAGPEAIMPLTRGADGKLGVKNYADNSKNDNDVVVNIYNYSNEKASQSITDNMNGGKSIDVMIGDAAASQAQKPGSNLNKALRTIVGSNQQVTRR